jgi:hypothetical protein
MRKILIGITLFAAAFALSATAQTKTNIFVATGPTTACTTPSAARSRTS